MGYRGPQRGTAGSRYDALRPARQGCRGCDIKTRRIIFTPTQELKDELADTAIQITCYDRNGEEVKRVTSADPGTVEDPEAEQGSDNGGNNGGGGDGGEDLDKD